MMKYTPQIQDFVTPDEWGIGGLLLEGDVSAGLYSGPQFRLESGWYVNMSYAINITVTGKPRPRKGIYSWQKNAFSSRIKIEFIGDGEPPTFSGGIIFHQ